MIIGLEVMNVPILVSAEAMHDHMLLIEFDNRVRKTYDVRPLLEKEMFAPLKQIALFKSVSVEPGGYAVAWGTEIDISEHELWQHGVEVQ